MGKGLLVKLGNYLAKHFGALKTLLVDLFERLQLFFARHWKAFLLFFSTGSITTSIVTTYNEFSDYFDSFMGEFTGFADFLPIQRALDVLNEKIDVSAVTTSSFAEIINAFGFVSSVNIIINGLGLLLAQVIFITLVKVLVMRTSAGALKNVILPK